MREIRLVDDLQPPAPPPPRRHLLGIRPDLTVELRLDLLREKDGPTLQHGLIGFQGRAITVPRRPDSRPNPDFLAERYELFRKAG